MDLVHGSKAMKAQRQLACAGIALFVSFPNLSVATAEPQNAPPSQNTARSPEAKAPPPTVSQPTPTGEQPAPTNGEAKQISVKIEPVAPLQLKNDKPSWITTYLVPTLGPIVSGSLAMFGIWLSFLFTGRTTEKNIWQKANETELKDLTAKLDGFYGPFLQMSHANHLIIEEFKSRQAPGFRTLIAVFNRAWLAGLPTGDRQIIAQVCEKAAVLEQFIAEKAGMVDSHVLPYLARASAHFRILHLAHEGKLGTDPTNFERYVYPKQLDAVIKLEIERLRQRCGELRAKPAVSPGPLRELVIPDSLRLDDWYSAAPKASSTI